MIKVYTIGHKYQKRLSHASLNGIIGLGLLLQIVKRAIKVQSGLLKRLNRIQTKLRNIKLKME